MPATNNACRPLARRFLAFLACALALSVASAAHAESPAEFEQQAFAQAVARVAPSLVRLQTVGGAEKVQDVLVGDGATTGIVVDPEGYIVSSAFSFAQKPAGIVAMLPSGEQLPAKLVATDHSRSLVLLKVTPQEPLLVPAAVPVDDVLPGWWAIAVGRTFEPRQPNVSIGIVSAVDRVWGKAIQTDAKISPANYGGPLVDIEGRVMGVLVPLSPQAAGITAGVDWYDSGIGFAIPYEHIVVSWKRLREGNDLHAGLLGVAMRGQDLYKPAVLAAARAGSPAAVAGLRAGDELVSINGRRTAHQAAVKTELGRLYAGDRVRVGVRRGEQDLEFDVDLVAELAPYDRPFLGILPEPLALDVKPAAKGVGVRWTYPEGPAAIAGVVAGDRIVKFAGQDVIDRKTLVEALEALPVGEVTPLTVDRGGQPVELSAKLARLPNDIPAELPDRPELAGEAPKERPPTGVFEPKLPDFENKLTAYVPADYDPRREYGLVIWLHPAGNADAAKTLDHWKPLCDRHGLILLAPAAKDPKRWDPAEIALLRRAAMQLVAQYNIDRQRVAVVGQGAGGSMAWLLALSARGLVRGLAVIEAALPLGAELPQNEPAAPLAVYAAWPSQTPNLPRITKGMDELRTQKFPVTTRSLGEQPRPLADGELAELARWIDSLDRI